MGGGVWRVRSHGICELRLYYSTSSNTTSARQLRELKWNCGVIGFKSDAFHAVFSTQTREQDSDHTRSILPYYSVPRISILPVSAQYRNSEAYPYAYQVPSTAMIAGQWEFKSVPERVQVLGHSIDAWHLPIFFFVEF